MVRGRRTAMALYLPQDTWGGCYLSILPARQPYYSEGKKLAECCSMGDRQVPE